MPFAKIPAVSPFNKKPRRSRVSMIKLCVEVTTLNRIFRFLRT